MKAYYPLRGGQQRSLSQCVGEKRPGRTTIEGSTKMVPARAYIEGCREGSAKPCLMRALVAGEIPSIFDRLAIVPVLNF
jgi:hypothetical protein